MTPQKTERMMIMNKEEFLNSLESRLKGLPDVEKVKSITYYSEAIDDRIEDGETEAEAVRSLGDINDIVTNVISQTSVSDLMKQKLSQKKKTSVPAIILIIIGSPIWLSVLLSLFAVVLGLYAAIAGIITALFAVVVSFLLGGAAAVIGSPIFMLRNISSGIFFIGSGLILVGLGIYLLFASIKLTKLIIGFTQFLIYKLKGIFVKREAEQQ